jgi:hypothetical protein
VIAARNAPAMHKKIMSTRIVCSFFFCSLAPVSFPFLRRSQQESNQSTEERRVEARRNRLAFSPFVVTRHLLAARKKKEERKEEEKKSTAQTAVRFARKK